MAEYDPKTLNANCADCWLYRHRDGGPVPPEMNPDAEFVVIGEAPGSEEVEHKRPFVGRSGQFLTGSLGVVGYKRSQVSFANALACRPPGNSFSEMESKWKKEQRERKKKGLRELPNPRVCCRPRLIAEIAGFDKIITLGNAPLKSLTGNDKGVTVMRGAPIVGWIDEDGEFIEMSPDERPAHMKAPRAVKILPMLHPAFVLRSQKWTSTFRVDLGRAVRWFTDSLKWEEPIKILYPTYEQIDEFLSQPMQIGSMRCFTCDVETSPYDTKEWKRKRSGRKEKGRYDPRADPLRCIGFGRTDAAICIPFRSVEDTTRDYYDSETKAKIVKRLIQLFEDPEIVLAGHNFGSYDRQVIRRYFCDLKKLLDTIILHRCAEPEMPHNLGYVGTVYTDVTAWKADKTGTDASSDQELYLYNIIDNVVTARVIEPLVEATQVRQQAHVSRLDHKVQRLCVDMHENGLYVDQKVRAELDKYLLGEAVKWRKVCRDMVGRPEFNPGSAAQVQDLLFEQWGLVPKHKSETTGEPSADDDTIREILLGDPISPEQARFLDGLRRFRRAIKYRGTYITKLRPMSEPISFDDFSEDEDEDEEEREARHKKEWKRKGIVWPDGRIRPNYNVHATVTGRLSSSDPNCFDASTEILTRRGWIPFPQLPRGEEVAQWREGKIEFVEPTHYTIEAYTGEMYSFRNQHIDLRVTRDHRCLLRHRRTGELRVFTADKYPEDWQQIQAGVYSNNDQGRAPWSDDLILLLCAVQADGSWVGTAQIPRLDFSFAKQRKIRRIREALDRLGAEYRIREEVRDTPFKKSAWRVRLVVDNCPAIDTVYKLLGPKKLFGPWIFDFTQRELATFCAELFLWDGCSTRLNNYSSSVKENVDWAQVAMSLRGWRTKMRTYAASSGNPNYQIDVTRRDFSLTTNCERSIERVVGELVYCVSVPSSYVVVRRNGRVMVTGQSQNWPDMFGMRHVLRAAPDHVLVGCDADQLEQRLSSAYWGMAIYLAAFHEGKDSHTETALMMFREMAREAMEATIAKVGPKKYKKEQPFKAVRDFAKTIFYAMQYAADPIKVHQLVQAAEDDKGNYIYKDVTLVEVRNRMEALHELCPEMKRGWEREVNGWKRKGYIVDPILGRRCDFLDGEDLSAMVNYPIQCIAGFTRILTDQGYIPVSELPGRRFRAWTGKRWAWATAFKKGEAELNEIRLDRGVRLFADASHKLLVVDHQKYAWRAVSEFRAGASRIALDRARPLEFGEEVDPEEAYCLGFWLAEGSATPCGEYDVALRWANNDREIIDRVFTWAKSRGLDPRLDLSRTCINLTVYVGGRAWLRSWGADENWRSNTKRIPERIWRVSLAARKAFIRGFLDGDGGLIKKGYVVVNLCQRKLLEELWLLMRTVGVDGNRVKGPYKADRAGHRAYRAVFSAALVWSELHWGRPAKLRTTPSGKVPYWQAQKLSKAGLKAISRSDQVIQSRLRHWGTTTNPYVLARMGANDIYDHARVIGVNPRRIIVPVYTLSVEDEEHRYVAEGFISANCGGHTLISLAMLDLEPEIPFQKWGPGTGIVQEVHDQLVYEVPAEHGAFERGEDGHVKQWCAPGCDCTAARTAKMVQEAMTRRVPGLDVEFTAEAKIGETLGEI